MNHSQIRNKLRALLGPRALWRTNMHAPDAFGRKEAAEKAEALKPQVIAAKEARDARYKELLRDPQYSALYDAHKALEKELGAWRRQSEEYPITVGTSDFGGMIFSVRAQGDSWPEVLGVLGDLKAQGKLRA